MDEKNKDNIENKDNMDIDGIKLIDNVDEINNSIETNSIETTDDIKRKHILKKTKPVDESVVEEIEEIKEINQIVKTEIVKKKVEAKRNPFRQYLHDVFNVKDDLMGFEEIDQMMKDNTIIHGSNMWILVMAILIASIGLNVNSIPVIIGAMLISPLMGGIMTMGYSLAVRDTTLMLKAAANFGTQVLISILVSTLYFLITPLDVPTTEMFARTSPTFWDVLIATCGGTAGMIGNTRNKKGNVIPGVAIATALMPPICTVGYGIATWQPEFILGASYLFLINTLFIAISTSIVTLILGVPYHKTRSEKTQRRMNRRIIVMAIIFIVPSLLIGARTVYDTNIDSHISNYLENEFVFEDTSVVKTDTDKEHKEITVTLVGNKISNDQILELQDSMDDYNLSDYKLHIIQNH